MSQPIPPTASAPQTPPRAPVAFAATRPVAAAVAVVIGVLTAGVYSLFSNRQWARLEVPSWDQGIFTQAAKSYSQGQWPISDIKQAGYPLLGDHFHPILALLGPIYRQWPSGLSVLLTQGALFALAAAVFAYVVGRWLGRGAGLAFGFAFAFSWAMQAAVTAQFHEVAFAVPLVIASLLPVVAGRYWWALPGAASLLLVKEDLGLTTAAIGVVLVVLTRRDRRALWPGLTLIGIGVVGVLLITQVIIPAINVDHEWAYADDSILSELLRNPAGAWADLTTDLPMKLLMLLMTGAVTGFVAFRSPIALAAVPTLLWRLTSTVPTHYGIDWHYSAVPIAILMVAMVDACQRWDGLRKHLKWLAVLTVIVALSFSARYQIRRVLEPVFYTQTERAQDLPAVLATLPAGSTVSSDILPLAYLVPDYTVYWIGGEEDPPADYVVITKDASQGFTASEWGTQTWPQEQWRELDLGGAFLVAERIAH